MHVDSIASCVCPETGRKLNALHSRNTNSTAHLQKCPNGNTSVMCGVHAAAVDVQTSVIQRIVWTVRFSGGSIRFNHIQ